MRRTLGMLVAVLFLGLLVQVAQATYPGRNGRIAFTILHEHPGGPITFSAATITQDGRARRSLGPIADVSWSATGRRLAAITPSTAPPPCATCGRGTVLVLAGARGNLIRSIATPEVNPYSPALSPDGHTIAFVQYVPVPGVDEQIPWIWSVRTDGTAPCGAPTGGGSSSPVRTTRSRGCARTAATPQR
jgi:WD40-like Beta Propeller Repeat